MDYVHVYAYGPKTGPAFLRVFFFCVVICWRGVGWGRVGWGGVVWGGVGGVITSCLYVIIDVLR